LTAGSPSTSPPIASSLRRCSTRCATDGTCAERACLYAAAEGAREVLQQGLEEMGAVVDRLELYRSVLDGDGAERLRALLLDGQADLVTFTSASSVNAFVEAVGDDASRCAPAAVDRPDHRERGRARGIEVVVEADESTIGGLVDAIRRHFTFSQART
jgi:uroporphyrinogen-III synthase